MAETKTVDAEVVSPGTPLTRMKPVNPKLTTPVKFDLVAMVQSPVFWMLVGGAVTYFAMLHYKRKVST